MLVARDTELGVHVVLELVVITVQMVGSDIHQDGYVGSEIVHVIQLERAEFNHIIVVLFVGYLQC